MSRESRVRDEQQLHLLVERLVREGRSEREVANVVIATVSEDCGPSRPATRQRRSSIGPLARWFRRDRHEKLPAGLVEPVRAAIDRSPEARNFVNRGYWL